MQIADLRLLFRLPVPELDPDVGCNLTIAAAMLNIISGLSVWFFHTDEAAAIKALESGDGRRRSRQRFVSFVEEYWPRIPPEPSPDVVAARLYEVRNSLAHDLGAYEDLNQEHARVINLAKHPMSLVDIVEALERNLIHPLTVPVVEEQGMTYTIHLSGVYWALHRMLRAALADHPKEIEAAIAAIEFPEIEETAD
jgi:hypothetical protein